MADPVIRVVAETRLPGPVPRWEVPGWRTRFGVVAGVTGRGDAGFDLGLWTRQPVGEVSGRWRQFLAAESAFPGAVLAHQVHGATVLVHRTLGPGWSIREDADGHVTATEGLLLLVTVADCVPVYLVDPVHRVITLLHAGWKGTAREVVSAGVRAMTEVAGTSPTDVVMHCGVAISGGCYEVGDEVAAACGKPPSPTGRQFLDLRAVLAEQGARLGLAEVSVSSHCTATEATSFYSHRRSGGGDGRQVAYLGMPGGRFVGDPA